MDHSHVSDNVAITILMMAFALAMLYAGFAAFLRWRHRPAISPKKKPKVRPKRHSDKKRRP